jgi:hypothetical protein
MGRKVFVPARTLIAVKLLTNPLGRYTELTPLWGQTGHHGDEFVGGVVLMINGIIVLFLSYETYGVGVFVPSQTLIGVKLLTA